ncbi:hypothetical protein Tco_1168726 [Tanacetum coccineum]
MIQESVQNTVQQSMGEHASVFQAQVHQTLEEQLDSLIYKPMNKQFHAFNKLKSQRFVHLEKELSKRIKTKLSKSARERVRTGMQYVNNKLSFVQDAITHNTQEKWEKNNPETPKDCEKEKDSEDEPPTKKLRVLIPTPKISRPTPLSSIILEHLLKPLEQKLSVEQFTDQLFTTTSSNFTPSPPREPTPLRDPSKDKGVTTKEPMKELIPYIEEGGSDPNMLKMKSLVTPEGVLSQEELMAQLKEMKRLADLKDEKEESEKALMKLIPQQQSRLRHRSWLNMRRKGQICLMNTTSVSMRGFIRCLSLRCTTRLKTLRKRKRTVILQEVFVKENIVVDGMHRNLILPPGVVGSRGQVMKGLSECKASESNIRRIQVKDIVKEIKDYLKTYSSAGMDISWYVEGIH